jgi:hypothetical protein
VGQARKKRLQKKKKKWLELRRLPQILLQVNMTDQPHRQHPTHFQRKITPVAPVVKKTHDRSAQTCT